MTGLNGVLLALAGLLLTQAIFAADTFKDQEEGVNEEYESLANKVAGKVSDRVADLLGGLPEEIGEQLSDLNPEEEMAVAGESLSRKVKSYQISGSEVNLSEPKKRVKRGTVGDGIPDEFEFTLEALDPFHTADPEFMIGDVIEYKLFIHASSIQTDVQVEIFSELSGGPFFMISHVEIGAVGDNFNGTFVKEDVVIRYHSRFADGRWDYATVDLGYIQNTADELTDPAFSKIEVLFHVQALPHDAYVPGDLYRVSVGAMYQAETYVTVAQDDLKYKDYDHDASPSDATFTISGPSSLNLGVTGVWVIEAAIYDLYSDIALDVLAPLHNADVMTVDMISVKEVGTNYLHSAVSFDDGGNFSRSTYENYGDYGRLSLGQIVNKGYHTLDTELAANTITFEVAITMANHTYNETSPYTVGFTIWKKDQESVEIMWSAQETVQAVSEDLAALSASPVFHWGPSADTVVVGGRFAILLNMSIPASTSARYVLEASVPVNSSFAMVDIESVRFSRVGFNLPHMNIWIEETPTIPTNDSTETPYIDFISWDLGIITNTGQRDGPDDQILQFEIQMKLLESSTDYYAEGDNLYISLGMKHAEDYYWVGRTSIVSGGETPIEYNAEKVPEFTFTNVMGPDAMIYPDSAAVYDLDMNVPAGVDYDTFSMEISTTNFTSEASQFRILSMEIIHVGSALHLENAKLSNLSHLLQEADAKGRAIYTVGHLEIDRITSKRDDNFDRYAYEDSTIRIRTIVVARSEPDIPIIDGETYWTETTVSFADSYIFAARSGVVFNSTIPNMYEIPADGTYVWQPLMHFAVKDGESAIVAKGAPVFFNVSFAVPYRTVSDLYVAINSIAPELQVCRLTYLSSNDAVVDFVPPSYDGDKLNTSTGVHVDGAYNAFPVVTSFDYGYFVDDVRDSYVTYEAIVMLNHKAVLGSNYSFSALMAMANGAVTNDFILDLSAADVKAKDTTLPEVYLGKYSNETETINYGGSELYFIDIYVPPNTQHHMVVNIFAPWNESFYGDYQILEAHIGSVGENLCCYEHNTTNIKLTRSSDNIGQLPNLAVVNLGYVPSVSPTDDNEIKVAANKLRILFHVAIPSNSTLAVDDVIPVAGTIDIDGEHLWVGYLDNKVVAHTDDSGNKHGNGDVKLEIRTKEDNIFTVGETQEFEGLLTLPPGASYADFKIFIESQRDYHESRLKIFDLHYNHSGKHLLEMHNDMKIIPRENNFGIVDGQEIDFKHVRNSDVSGHSAFVDHENDTADGLNDNEFLFTFKMQLLDTAALINGFNFTLDVKVQTGSDLLAEGSGNTTIFVQSNATADNAVLNWDVNIVEQPATVYQDSVLVFDLSLSLVDLALRFPSDVEVHYRVPKFSELHDIYNVTVVQDQYIAPAEVKDDGLTFKWKKMRYEEFNYLRFNITVDPDFTLEPGLGTKRITIPVDISYKRENRTVYGTYDSWFTEMRQLSFYLEIPENYNKLGMADSTIKDCQISASSSDGTHLPENARPCVGGLECAGWSMAENRGPPLFQNEYIQVDFSGDVKFTGLIIYAFDNSGTANVVTKFKVRFSRRGVRWNDVLDNNLQPVVFEPNWGVSPAVTDEHQMEFGKSAFIARHVRVIPLENSPVSYTGRLRFELLGYPWPMGTTLPTYTCPTVDGGLKPYVERQILAVPDTLELYACTLAKPGDMPYCSGTMDFGVTWFPIDDNVMNIYGHDGETAALYGLARDRESCLRSVDNGYSWKAIDCDLYSGVGGASLSGSYTAAKEVPFPMVGANTGDLYSNYGFKADVGGSQTWSVSEKALHAYNVDDNSLGPKGDGDDQVAYWGTEQWNV